MSRYIDAEKAKEKKVYSKDRHEYVVPVAELDWLPKADVQEVKTGYWEWFEDWGFNGEVNECVDAGYRCSECKTVPHENLYFDIPEDIPPFRYCPHCGAKMDEEEKQQ